MGALTNNEREGLEEVFLSIHTKTKSEILRGITHKLILKYQKYITILRIKFKTHYKK